MSDRRETDALEIDPQDGGAGTALPPEGDLPDETKPPAPEADDTQKELRRTLREQRLALKESNEAARYWMEQARTGAGAAAAKTPAPADPSTSVDLVEAITNGDGKAITQALRDLGFVRQGDVENVVGASNRARTSDERLYEKYPDLADDQSPFFLAAAAIYQDLARRDPILKKSGMLGEIAADLAAGRERDEAPAKRGAARDSGDREIDDADPDEEEERVARVRRQAGDRGSRSTAGQTRGGDDELDSTQRSIVAKLRAAGAQITEEAYRKRAQAGVRMSGMPTRRPRY
jgi:hypothetical protein